MYIDLNSDLGENYGAWRMGDDKAMLGIVTSANVACGFHAGDPRSVLETLKEAAECGVTVGAHVAYPDLSGFGRREMNLSASELEADVIYQIGALAALAKAAGTTVSYVKPHGALYNTIARDERQAAAVIRALQVVNPELPLVCLAASQLIEQARDAGLRPVAEAFADRAYEPSGLLVSRREAGAVLHDPAEVAARMLTLVKEGTVTARDGSEVRLDAESICVHGDSDGAVQMAIAVREHLVGAGVSLRSFVGQR
ncbi:LamB/YcsF family protein [Corynebacterium pacaense]|uniref:LamB/YcsF family protein n=1 Tax=Corynebacterium pacaense TaxID=1816684 RepID=UPI0009BC70D1|nr:5-oxoprolinase subunit PxpA [Corynebacterium pacaense]